MSLPCHHYFQLFLVFFNHFCFSQFFNPGLTGRDTMLKLSNTCNTHRSCCDMNYGMYKSEHKSQLLAQMAQTRWLQWAYSMNTVFCVTHSRREIKQRVINVPMHTEHRPDTRPKSAGSNQDITGQPGSGKNVKMMSGLGRVWSHQLTWCFQVLLVKI